MDARTMGLLSATSLTLSLSKCVPEKRKTAGMRGGNVLGCMAGMCCKMCYTEPVEVRARKRETAGMRGRNVLGCVAGMCCKMRARKTGNCWDAWRECAGMHGRNVLQNV